MPLISMNNNKVISLTAVHSHRWVFTFEMKLKECSGLILPT